MDDRTKVIGMGAALASLAALGAGLLWHGDRKRGRDLDVLRNKLSKSLIDANVPEWLNAMIGDSNLSPADILGMHLTSDLDIAHQLHTLGATRVGNTDGLRRLLQQTSSAVQSGQWRLMRLRKRPAMLVTVGDPFYASTIPADAARFIEGVTDGPRVPGKLRSNPGSGASDDGPEIYRRWRLVLGPEADKDLQEARNKQCQGKGNCPKPGQGPPKPGQGQGKGQGRGKGQGGEESRPSDMLGKDDQEMDEALHRVYEGAAGSRVSKEGEEGGKKGAGSLDKSAPWVATWLGDVRKHFEEDVVSMIEMDAIQRLGLDQLLFEKETLEKLTPSVDLVGTLLTLKEMVPDETKATARMVVQKVVDEIKKKIATALEQAVRGALDKAKHHPIESLENLDYKRTIEQNLKTYDRSRGIIVPENISFYARQQRSKQWNIIVAMDESGSMASSVVYASVMACIFASLPALEVHVVAFDTEVVDQSGMLEDPVDLLFAVQLGGGTDIMSALRYCQTLVHQPDKTLLILITDLFENATTGHDGVVHASKDIVESGVKMLCMTALNDDGAPSYDQELAKQLMEIGIPAFACTPNVLPRIIETVMKGQDLKVLLAELVASGVKLAEPG